MAQRFCVVVTIATESKSDRERSGYRPSEGCFALAHNAPLNAVF